MNFLFPIALVIGTVLVSGITILFGKKSYQKQENKIYTMKIDSLINNQNEGTDAHCYVDRLADYKIVYLGWE